MDGCCLTSSVFPRSPDRQRQVQIPLGVVVGPVKQMESENLRPPRCEVCGAFLFPGDQSARFCRFCKNVCLNVPALPSSMVQEWTEPAPCVVKTMILLDGSMCSKCGNFFKTVVDALPDSLPRNLSNFALGCFSSDVVLLRPGGSLLCYPDLSESVVPSLAFHKVPPSTCKGLLTYVSLQRADVVAALRFAERAVGPHGRVVLVLGSPPKGFTRVEPLLELTEMFSGNFTPEITAILNSFKEGSITVDMLVNIPTSNSIDLITLTDLVAPLRGRIFVTDETIQSKIGNFLAEMFACFPVSVHVKLPTNLEGPRFTRGRFCNTLDFEMNSSNSEYLSIQMKTIGEMTAPCQCVFQFIGHDQLLHVRVVSFDIPCSDDLASVFTCANAGAFLKAITNQLIDRWRAKHEDVKELLLYSYTLLVPFLKGYNMYIANSPEPVMPPALADLPRWVLGCLKSSVFSYGTFMSERYYYMHRMYHMPVSDLATVCYPVMYDVSAYLLGSSDAITQCSLSKTWMHPERILLLDDGFHLWVWVGRGVSETLCYDLFGTDDFDTLVDFHPNDTPVSQTVWHLINRPVKLCVHNSVGHHTFTLRLVEDSIPGIPGPGKYLQGLAHIIKHGSAQ